MAEGYSGETQCSTYIYQRLHYVTSADSTGHNVYVELQMRRTNSYGGATLAYPSQSYININGDSYTWNWNANSYPQIPAYNTNWLTFASRTVHVNHGGAVTIGISGGNNNMGVYLSGSTSANITLESIYSSPATPSISGSVIDAFSNRITFGTSSFGNPSSGTVYLYRGTTNAPTTQIASKTSTGSSAITDSGLLPNTTYYYRARAYNGQIWSGYSSVISVKTKPGNYVSVNGKSRPVNKYYAPLGLKSRQVLKIYDSVNGKSRRIF